MPNLGKAGGAASYQVEIPVFATPVFLPVMARGLLLYFVEPNQTRLIVYSHFHFLPLMTTGAITANILSPKKFARRAARWAIYVSKTNSEDLRRCFFNGEEKRLQFLSFSTRHLASLVSTVGIRHIQVRFLVDPPSKDGLVGKARFTMALYATDALGARVSAYYLPVDEASASAAPAPEKGLAAESESGALEVGGQAPHDLVKGWVTNWASAPEITSDMFFNSYGPLQGYTFSLDDFLQELFTAQPFTDEQMVRISFGLHEYYPAVAVNSGPVQTFGLVLRVFPAPAPKAATPRSEAYGAAAAQSAAPFFDLSTPCPPGT